MNIGKTGGIGESLTAEFLRKNGFTEVKTRRELSLVSPAEAVDTHKQRRIILTAEDFLSKYETELQPRFDVAEVTVYKKNDGTDGYKLHYIKNAF